MEQTQDAEHVPLEDIRKRIAERVKELGSQTKAAAYWHCTLPMVNMVVVGRRNPTQEMLDDLGLEKIASEVSYRRKSGT